MSLVTWLVISWVIAGVVIIGIMCAGRDTSPETFPGEEEEYRERRAEELRGKVILLPAMSDRQVERHLMQLATDTGLIWFAEREGDSVLFTNREPGVEWPDEEEIDEFLAEDRAL